MLFKFICLVKSSVKLKLHVVSIFIELIGTVFVFLDAIRLNSRTPPDALGTFGDPLNYRHWWYHASIFGFLFLLLGIVLQSVVIFYEAYDDRKLEKRVEEIEESIKSIQSSQKLNNDADS